jgi:hypothetical protein
MTVEASASGQATLISPRVGSSRLGLGVSDEIQNRRYWKRWIHH